MPRAGSNVTYPYTNEIGHELHSLIGKDQWLALVVDLLRASLGEDTPVETLRAEIAARLDVLHGNGIVPRTLPARLPRADLHA